MNAAYYEQFQGPITIETLPDPVPPAEGVVLRVRASGLCRSDWHGWQGHDPDITLPHVPGHELAGEIVAVGKDVRRHHTGERVTLPFVCGCGRCPQCASGNHQVCDFQFQPGFTHWGSFAEFVAVDYADTNLVPLPDAVDDVAAAALGCRFITAYRALAAQGRLQGGQWVAVHGCGGVGLSAILIAAAFGAQVIGVDISEEKLAFARELGAAAAINGRFVADVPEAVREISGGGAHVSLDALGSQETCFNSIANLRKRGKHIQVGLMTGDHRHPQVPMDRVIAHELEVLGSHGMQAFAYEPMLSQIVSGALQPQKLVGRRIRFDEAPAELAAMDSFPGTGIAVIDRF
ncbi:MAG: zinc-dependent alcohol dehydrogenase family protein [Candidatus Promineifilaceae bacterium]|jgi:alcohol dehydrogenase